MRIKGKLPWSIESPSIHLVQPNERVPLVHEVVSRQPSLSEDDTILFTLADQEWKLPKTLKKEESLCDRDKNSIIEKENCALKCGYISPSIFPESQQQTTVKRNAFFNLGTSSRNSSSSSSNEVICEKNTNSLGSQTEFNLYEENIRNKPNFDEIIQELKNDNRKNSESSDLSTINATFSRNNSLDVNDPAFYYVEVDLNYRSDDDRKPVRKSFSEETFDKNKIQNLQERNVALKNCSKRVRTVSRTSSCDEWCEEMWNKMNPNDKRRVSQMVDELLTEIYGLSVRPRKKVGVFNCGRLSNSAQEDIDVFSEHDDEKSLSDEWRKKTLERKDITEVTELLSTLKAEIKRFGARLVRHLKRRDCYKAAREWHCNWLTAYLQANSEKRSEDTHTRFSLSPSPGESGFAQWQNGMRMVARLPEGIPAQFRKTLWLTLAEKHLAIRGVNWQEVEEFCFNEFTNPDDEELGVQIVKDVHRTGCSLFCGVSGQHNQALLKRVLLAYARWNKSVGYCQGFNMLAALILQVMDKSEVDSVKVMIYLIEGVLPESYFANNLRGLSVDMAVFRDLLRIKLPSLSRHLEQLQCDSKESGTSYEPPLTNVFTMQWFLTLFCNCLPQDTVLRVWDLIFLEGNHILLKTALAIWNTLSDRILSVESADEFYSIMGVLTREMLEFGLMDANTLIKAIASINLPEISEMRERYLYNITPWTLSVTTVARKGLRLFYSDDDTDTEEDEKIAVANAYGLFRSPKKKDAISNMEFMSHRTQNSVSGHSEKIMDIATLKKQYCKLRERQRQAHIILTAACGGQSLVGPTPSPAMNHLLLGKCALVNNRGRRLGPPPGAVPPPHRTKESATDYLEKVHDGLDLPHNESKSMEPVSSPVSPQSSRRDSSSSTSTELCDDPQLSDSEDKTSSFNECSVVLDPISGDTSDSKARGSGDLNTQSLPYSVVTDKENMQKFHENVIEDNTMKKNDDGIPHTSSTEFFNFKIDPKEIKELDRKLSLKIEEIEREKRRKSFNNLENQELIDSMVLFPFDRDYIKDNDVILEDSAEDIKEQALFFSGKKYIKDTLPNWSQNNKLQNKVTAVSDASTNQSHKVTTDSCELTSDNCDIIQSSESEVIVDYNWCKSNFKNAEEESMKIDYSKLEHVNYEYRMKFESDQHHRSDHLQVSNTFHKLYDEDKVLVSLKGEVQSTSNKNQQALETKFLTDENIPELKHFQTTDEYTTETFLMKNIESHASRNEPDLPEKKTKSTSRRGSEVALSLILEENSQILSKFHQKSKKITTTSSDKRLEYSKDICMDKMKIIKQNKLHSHLLESTMERTEGHVTDDKESCKVRLSTKLIKGIVPDTSKTEDTTDMTKKCDNITLSGEQDSKRFVKENVNNTLSHTFENVGSFRRKTTLESDETDSQNFVRDKSPVNISAANQYLNLFQKDYMNMGTTNLKYPIENMTKNSGYEIKSSNLDVNDEFSFSEDRLPDVCPLSLFVKTDASHLSFLESRSNNEDKAGASRDASKKDICEVDSTSAVQFHTVVTNEGITRFAECKSLQENQFYKKQSTETTPEYFSKFSDNIFNKPDFKKFSHSLELTTDRKSIISKTENEKSNLENSSDTDESYSQYHVKYSRQKTDSTSTFLKEPIFESEQKLGCSFPSLCQNNDDTNTSDSSSTFDSTLEKNEAGDKLKPNSRFRYRSESVCNDTEISYTSTSPTVFNPFPSRVSARPPKELGVKLGLYLPSKTCKLPNKNNT